MVGIKLSDHFLLDELVKTSNPRLTSVQWFMLRAICVNVLEPLRTFANEQFGKATFTVTSGMRSPADRARLIREGYHPSETTDHDYGQVVKLTSDDKVLKYGQYYHYSVGAVDVVPSCGANKLFEVCKPYFKRDMSTIALPSGDVRVGQFILELHNGNYWLHVSNHPTILYGSVICDFIKKTCFLKSLDNGKSYQRV